ncbi:hypothetical protein VNI00_009254 [Paramarasmius palmivorus]|uniref:BEACH domain-containing protein n=1 Tax=Paramarasmius palmivorus TaxID=297713 RepID=A0AAW0CS02_9AGAR
MNNNNNNNNGGNNNNQTSGFFRPDGYAGSNIHQPGSDQQLQAAQLSDVDKRNATPEQMQPPAQPARTQQQQQ